MKSARHPLTRRGFLTSAAATLALPAVARGAAPVTRFDGTAFATGWQITLAGGAGKDAARMLAAIRAHLAAVDREMSPWRGDSDVTRFNRAGTGPCPLPAALRHVAGAALDIAEASRGAFDPTVGPLVARWGFGPIDGEAGPGWEGLGRDAGGLVKAEAGLTLDLCGIAKGHALDGIAAILEAAGHDAFLADLGGEVFARGLHPEGRPWQVGVEDPRVDAGGMAEVLALSDMAVATSGDRENGYWLGARRYSHIIDPATEEPVAGRIASVSVIAGDAMTADGWATALMAAGGEAGPALARARGLSALFLMRDGGGLGRVTTGAFDSYLA